MTKGSRNLYAVALKMAEIRPAQVSANNGEGGGEAGGCRTVGGAAVEAGRDEEPHLRGREGPTPRLTRAHPLFDQGQGPNPRK